MQTELLEKEKAELDELVKDAEIKQTIAKEQDYLNQIEELTKTIEDTTENDEVEKTPIIEQQFVHIERSSAENLVSGVERRHNSSSSVASSDITLVGNKLETKVEEQAEKISADVIASGVLAASLDRVEDNSFEAPSILKSDQTIENSNDLDRKSEKEVEATEEKVVAEEMNVELENKVEATEEKIAVAEETNVEAENEVEATEEKVVVAEEMNVKLENKVEATEEKVVVAEETNVEAKNEVEATEEKVAIAEETNIEVKNKAENEVEVIEEKVAIAEETNIEVK